MSSFIPETKGTGAYVHDDDRNSKQICCICESNEPNAKIRSAATLPRAELVLRKEPCPFCRRPIEGFDVGKWSSVIGEHGLWPTSLVNLRNLASGEGFNEYFQQMFDGNEKAYERWQSTFDRLGILKEIKDEGSGVEMETQVFIILNSNDMAKLRAVEQICHQDYFHDSTLLVVARRRILDVLMMADPAGGWNERSYQERYDEAKFRNLPLPKRKRRGKGSRSETRRSWRFLTPWRPWDGRALRLGTLLTRGTITTRPRKVTSSM